MEGVLRDIRFSVRSLRKRPAFSLLVVLVLALAIAANICRECECRPTQCRCWVSKLPQGVR